MAKTINIYIDGQPLARQKDGVGAYTVNLLEELLDKAPSHYRFRAMLFTDQRATPKLIAESQNFSYCYLPFTRRMYALIVRLWFLPINFLLPTSVDAVWYPNFVCFPYIMRARRIVTIHDFTYEHFPEMVARRNLSYLRRMVPRSIKKASHLLAVSHSVADEAHTFFPKAPDASVIYPKIHISATPKQPQAAVPKQYILFVGTLEPRKNISGLLDAFEALPEDIKQTYPLVVAGRKGWIDSDTFARFEQLANSGHIRWFDGPSDDELAYLYHHARLFVLMSHYEGYGMPLAEAQSLGLPTIALDTPINRETTNNTATYVTDASSAANAITRELRHPRATSKPLQPIDSPQAGASLLLSLLCPTDKLSQLDTTK